MPTRARGGKSALNTARFLAAKIGQAVDIVVMRDGQRMKITVTPEARK